VKPRFHARFPGALCEGLTVLGGGARLAAYRIEPVRTVDGPQHYLDLTFADGDRVAVVAGIRIDRYALAHRDRSPFVAPREALAVAEQLETAFAAIEPVLIEAFTACAEPTAMMHVFAGVADEALAARTVAHALGAAPYVCVARARGRAVDDGAYVETCFGGDVPLVADVPVVPGFGASAASLRCYVALSDASLAAGGAAYRTGLAVGAALGCDDVAVDVAGYDGRPLEPYAFVHAIGLDDPHAAAELIAAARGLGIRTLLTPLFDDAPNGGFWGARTHARTLALGDDEEVLGLYLGAVVARETAFAGAAQHATPYEPRAGFRAAQRDALGADVVFIASASEAKLIRALGVDRVFAAYVPAPDDVRAPDPGVAPYVLAVAPVGPPHASATLARAAARAGLPVRFTGAVVDGAYAARARSYLDDRSSFAPGDPGRGARVVADVSWAGTDLSALASHAVHGVPVVGSNRAALRDVFGSSGVWEVDPADEVAIAAALCEAWNGAGEHATALSSHVAARCRLDVLQSCLVKAYAAPVPVT
jgi:hypothetical protein